MSKYENYKSPYRELGVSAEITPARKAAPKVAMPSRREMKRLDTGHDFISMKTATRTKQINFGRRATTRLVLRQTQTEPCRRCGLPRFSIEGRRCAGKKKRMAK